METDTNAGRDTGMMEQVTKRPASAVEGSTSPNRGLDRGFEATDAQSLSANRDDPSNKKLKKEPGLSYFDLAQSSAMLESGMCDIF